MPSAVILWKQSNNYFVTKIYQTTEKININQKLKSIFYTSRCYGY